MSTTINVTVGGNDLLDQSRQQMQANRFSKLERDQDAKTTTEAQRQKQSQGIPLLGTRTQTLRSRQEPAAYRRKVDDTYYFLIETRIDENTGSPYLFNTEGDVFIESPPYRLLSSGGPFDDPCVFQPEYNSDYFPSGSTLETTIVTRTAQADFTIAFWFWWDASEFQYGLRLRGPATIPGEDRGTTITFTVDFDDAINGLSAFIGYTRYELNTPYATGVAYRVPNADQSAWHHIAFQRQNGTMRFYFDGTIVGPYDEDSYFRHDLIFSPNEADFGRYAWRENSSAKFGQFAMGFDKTIYDFDGFALPSERLRV